MDHLEWTIWNGPIWNGPIWNGPIWNGPEWTHLVRGYLHSSLILVSYKTAT